MRPEVQDKIISIIAHEAMLEPSQVRPEMTLEEIGLDSLGLVEMIFAIEETFGVSVPFNANEPGESLFDITSVGSIVTAVEGLIAERGAAVA